jgi:hypothetical protein
LRCRNVRQQVYSKLFLLVLGKGNSGRLHALWLW